MQIRWRGIAPRRWGFGMWRAPRGKSVLELGPVEIIFSNTP